MLSTLSPLSLGLLYRCTAQGMIIATHEGHGWCQPPYRARPAALPSTLQSGANFGA